MNFRVIHVGNDYAPRKKEDLKLIRKASIIANTIILLLIHSNFLSKKKLIPQLFFITSVWNFTMLWNKILEQRFPVI